MAVYSTPFIAGVAGGVGGFVLIVIIVAALISCKVIGHRSRVYLE